jgi:hypothetical protein
VTVTPALIEAAITQTVSATSPRAGDAITVSGRLSASGSPLPGVTVKIQSSVDGSTWTDAASATTNASGDFSVSVTPAGPTHYRAMSVATATHAAATSSSTLVTPQLRATSLTITGPAASPRTGVTFALTGRLTETGAGGVSGATVRVQRSIDGSTWTDATSVTTNASGEWTYSTSLAAPTHYRAVHAANTLHAPATSTSLLVAPSEPDDEIAGAITPSVWPHVGAIRDAYDTRDILFLATEGSGHPVDLAITGPAGAILDLELHRADVTSLDAASPLRKTSGSSWPKGLRFTDTAAASYLLVVRRVSGSGSYSITRTDHASPEATFVTTSPRRVRYGSSAAVQASVIERPWLTSNPVQLRIVSGGKTRYVTSASHDGAVSYSFKPTRHARVSVRNAASGSSPAGTWSSPLEVRVTHALSTPTVSKTSVSFGERFTIKGTLAPAHPVGTTVILEALSASGARKSWRVKVKSRTSTSCTWSASGTPPSRGTWRFRVRVPKDSLHDEGVSAYSRAVVVR